MNDKMYFFQYYAKFVKPSNFTIDHDQSDKKNSKCPVSKYSDRNRTLVSVKMAKWTNLILFLYFFAVVQSQIRQYQPEQVHLSFGGMYESINFSINS